MRILFLSDYFPRPGRPTIGTWALDQSKALARAGHCVLVAVPSPFVPRSLSKIDGRLAPYAKSHGPHLWGGIEAAYVRTPYYPTRRLRGLYLNGYRAFLEICWLFLRRELLSLMESHRADVIYAHHTIPNGYWAQRLSAQTGVPFAITDHDYWPIERCAERPRVRRLYRAIKRQAVLNTTVSMRMLNASRSTFPGARIENIYNGVDIPQLRHERSRDGEILLLTAAMLYERKDTLGLIDSMELALKDCPSLRLRIVGDGPMRAVIERRIEERQLAGVVQLCGLLSHEDTLNEIQCCDIFALTGWSEPWGVAITEAMAAAKPVIYSTDGGIGEVLNGKGVAVGCDPHDVTGRAAVIATLASDASMRTSIGSRARSFAEENLSWDSHAAILARALQGALPSAAGDRSPDEQGIGRSSTPRS